MGVKAGSCSERGIYALMPQGNIADNPCVESSLAGLKSKAFRWSCGRVPQRRFVLGFVAAVAVFVSGASPSSAAPQPVVLGANTFGITADTGKSLDQFAAEIGRMPRIAMYYRDWNEGWSTALIDPRIIDPILARHAIPMITWEPYLSSGNQVYQPAYSPATIAAGAYDHYIRRAAREAAAFGRPIFIRFAHEMNGSWSPWGAWVDGNTPADYIAMWRHVVSIFRAEGATNVRWVWSPNVYNSENDYTSRPVRPFQPYYPGDHWVDFVALDGYNWGSVDGSEWQSFDSVFGSSYDAITKLTNKPLMIAETGSTELGGVKAAWIRAIPGVLRSKMPKVRALIWFNQDKETDWQVDSSPASEVAFRAIAQSPILSGSVSGLLAAESMEPALTSRRNDKKVRRALGIADATVARDNAR